VSFPFPQVHLAFVNDAHRFPTQTSRAVVQCQPWFYLRLFAYRFFWLSEGAKGFSKDSVPEAHA
jgi:hypothetical protein